MVNTKLKTLSSDDFKPFPGMVAMGFVVSKLEALDGDLFIHNPLLQHINFNDNQITNVGPNILDPVPLLYEFFLSANLCSQESSKTVEETHAFALKLRYQCPPSVQMIEKIILSGQKFEFRVDGHVAERINPAVLRIYENEKRIDELETLLQQLMAAKA